MLRRLLWGVGAVLACVALSAGGLTTAAQAKSSALCGLDTKFTRGATKAETSIAAAIESGNWASAQRALLSAVTEEKGDESALEAALHGAPAKVHSAAQTMIGFAGTEVHLIRSAQTASQFETNEETAAENPKIESAERTLASYTSEKCGTPTPASATTP